MTREYLSRHSTTRRTRSLRFVLLAALVWSNVGCGLPGYTSLLDGFLLPTSQLEVQIKRRGCSEFSKSAVLTAVTPNTDRSFQWYFTDGTVEVGQSVVHSFNNRGEYQVTLFAGSESRVIRVSIPVLGEPDDGPDPFGDTCIPPEGEQHIPQGTPASYRSKPPASGPHYSGAGLAPIAPGFYEQPVQPEVWVHNLEHGNVVVLFDCQGDCPSDFLDGLRAFFYSRQAKLVVTRYPGLPVPIMAVGWQVQRGFNVFNAEEPRAFYDRRVGEAPEG
ncbi:MAG: DUF3105 domain-containing protein [Phycisphaerae bacterium]|nr:DUF3105 domain-containing protein [Phycisphaerae bacterium]